MGIQAIDLGKISNSCFQDRVAVRVLSVLDALFVGSQR
jgi:hypothetical protein